jgi:MFS family permease
MHVVNDALFVGLNPLLPLIALDLGLGYAQVGAVRAAFSGASAALQVPAGIAAERFREQTLLAVGTGWVGSGMLLMSAATGFWLLLVLAVAAGLGGNLQHPVATAIVSRLYDGGRRATAIGTLNFTGDVGKVLAPLLVGAVAAAYDWRMALVALGGLGAVFALGYVAFVPEPARGDERSAVGAARAVGGWGIVRPGYFGLLVGIGIMDSAARGAALTFVPFVLAGHGYDVAAISLAFTLLFAAGAAGKFLCGPLADRFGNVAAIVVTEVVTAAAIVGLVTAPGQFTVLVLLPLGFALNGTSSVLYATVASFVEVERRARGYGLYFTCTLLASALAPVLYGVLADAAGLAPALLVLAAVTGAIAPIALLVRRGLA